MSEDYKVIYNKQLSGIPLCLESASGKGPDIKVKYIETRHYDDGRVVHVFEDEFFEQYLLATLKK